MAAHWYIGWNPILQVPAVLENEPVGQIGENGQVVPPAVIEMTFPGGFPFNVAMKVVENGLREAANLGTLVVKHTVVDLKIGSSPAWTREMFVPATPPVGGGGGGG